MKSESMRIKEISLRQDPDLRKELALLARGCDFVLPSRFKKRLKAFQQVQVCLLLLIPLSYCCQLYLQSHTHFRKYMQVFHQLAGFRKSVSYMMIFLCVLEDFAGSFLQTKNESLLKHVA